MKAVDKISANFSSKMMQLIMCIEHFESILSKAQINV